MDIILIIASFIIGAGLSYFLLQNRLNIEKDKHHKLDVEYNTLKATADGKEAGFQQQLKILEETKKNLKIEFENLSQKIYEQNSEKLKKDSKSTIEEIMNPVKEQLKDFKSKIEHIHETDIKERTALQEGIKRLHEMNQTLSTDAQNLSNALKNDKKLQGNWGEVILERVLEQSGLTKDREYFIQQSHTDEENKRQQPDVIIKLPDGKDIIIDSKVSLVDFQRYYEAVDDDEQTMHLNNHTKAIEQHIKSLSDKKYQDIKEIETLDFVFLFVPIENAFFAAINNKTDLFQIAYDKNIMLVCPSTLHLALRTVKDIWRKDAISKEAQNIAEKAGKLYDKFAGFVDNFQNVGKHIKSTQKTYTDAFNQLATGRGNLLKSAKELSEMGVKNSKQIPENDKASLTDSEQERFDDTLTFNLEE